MKILYASRGYTSHDHRFLSAIVEAGHVAVFLKTEKISADPRPLPIGVQKVSGEIKGVLKRVKPDLVHSGPLHTAGYSVARTSFHPLVQMSWGSDILWEAQRKPSVRKRIDFALNHSDAVIGDCEAVRFAVRKAGVKDKDIFVFPWGVDLKRFKPGNDGSLRARLGWQSNFVILHLRSMESLYDPVTIARGFVLAARQNASLRMMMLGGGTLAGKVKAVFANAGLQDHVHMPGSISQDKLPVYYRAADLYTSASLSDGSSVSLMEAMASGLPSLVSDIPSNREWVQAGEQGWLFQSKNAKQFAEFILQSAEKKDLDSIGQKARMQAERKADWSVNKKILFHAYAHAVENGKQ
jgi:glycosyltransferase involved in cell wall biosynthesis